MELKDLLFPKKCIGCRAFGEYVCTNCFATLSFDSSYFCLVCGNPCIEGITHPVCKNLYAIDGAFCGFSYKGVVKKLLYAFKYKPYLSDISSFLSALLWDSLIQQEHFTKILQKENLALVPIPLSSKKRRIRGYNQSELLAKSLSKKFTLPMVNMLKRKIETKPQFNLKREERRKNIKGAFECTDSEISQTVFLIDDVLTTGSTLLEAANVLKRNGIQEVYGICFARDY